MKSLLTFDKEIKTKTKWWLLYWMEREREQPMRGGESEKVSAFEWVGPPAATRCRATPFAKFLIIFGYLLLFFNYYFSAIMNCIHFSRKLRTFVCLMILFFRIIRLKVINVCLITLFVYGEFVVHMNFL